MTRWPTRYLADIYRVFLAKTIGTRTPLLVAWTLTNRCNFTCEHCERWRLTSAELDTAAARTILRDLAAMGTYAISFVGGEVMLREDLGQLLADCRRYGIKSRVTSNGSLVTKYPERVAQADILKLSLDGPPAQHDRLRGAGSFNLVMDAAHWAKSRSIPVLFNCLLSKHVSGHIAQVLDLAATAGVPVTFQPVEDRTLACGGDPAAVRPTAAQMREMLSTVKQAKKAHPSRVGNSPSGLSYLESWPNLTPVDCLAGLLFCRVLPDGRVAACDRVSMGGEADAVAFGFRRAFDQLRRVGPCEGCWRNNTIDLNLALSLDPGAILSLIRTYL